MAALALPVTACSNSVLSTTQSISPVERQPQRFVTWSDAVPAYEFVPGDKIKVQFELTPELGEDALVSPDGTISLRAAGQVQAAGLTARQLQDAISAAASKTLVHPVVVVALTESPGSQVFVGGAVTKPGAYLMPGRHGSFEAVQLAGGFTPEARLTEVVLIRRSDANRPMLRTVDLRSLMEGSDDHPDVPLMAGDIVFVPRNKISEVDLWVDSYLNRFVPFNKALAFSYVAGGSNH